VSVIDADPASPKDGRVVATISTGTQYTADLTAWDPKDRLVLATRLCSMRMPVARTWSST
jgi:hypothetical protein